MSVMLIKLILTGRIKGKKKVDIMGAVSVTADRLGLSYRKRTMFAASVANAT